jgi:hypothetical protein
MSRTLGLVFVAAFFGIASAQPGGAPPAPPPPPPPPAVTIDRAQFDAAFDAMVRGDFAKASDGFHAVAAGGAPELRAQATELARLADALIASGAKLVTSGAPGANTGGGGVSEDDAVDGGRTSFIVTTTMASLDTGLVAIDLLNINDVRSGTALVMGSTAAGVIGSIYGTQGRTMTGGMADAWSLGLLVGAGNALLLSEPFGLYRSPSNSSEKVQTFTLAATWGTATAGLLIADRIRPTRAQVNVVETFGLMGVGSTLLSLAIIQPSLDADSFTTITALGLDAGLGVGAGFAGKLDWSNSRARLVQLSAFLGGLTGVGTSLILLSGSNGNGDSALRTGAGITLAGLWGGFALGMHLTRDMDPDYRFRHGSGTQVTFAPTALARGAGLSVVGSF